MKLDWCVIQIHIKDNFPSSENYLSEVQAYEAWAQVFPDITKTTGIWKEVPSLANFHHAVFNSVWIENCSLKHFWIVSQEYGSVVLLCQNKRDFHHFFWS